MTGTLNTTYHYDSHRDFEFKGDYESYVMKIVGVVFLFTSIYDLFLKEDQTIIGYVLSSIMMILSLFYLFSPLTILRPWKKHATFIKLEDGKLSWNLNGRNKEKVVDINEIESVHLSVGDAVVKMKSGESHNIQVHKIHNKKKYEEFVNLLKSLQPK